MSLVESLGIVEKVQAQLQIAQGNGWEKSML